MKSGEPWQVTLGPDLEGRPLGDSPEALIGSGIYLGLASSAAIALFGLTIVVKRASRTYTVVSADDDV